MKLTWFGGTTLRVHVGGQILVMDAAALHEGVDRTELVSGADRVFESDTDLSEVDAVKWRPRMARRLVDEDGPEPNVAVWAVDRSVLVDAIGEPPLLIVTGRLPRLGRWAWDAVVVVFGDGPSLYDTGKYLLDLAPPKLLVLAGHEADVDFAISGLTHHLDETGLMALEAGMAVEV